MKKMNKVIAIMMMMSITFAIRVFNMMYPDFVPFLSKPFFF